MAEWLLGLGGSDHDFSATVACGTDIRVAVEQERLSRRKHGASLWYENPVGLATDYCLADAGITAEQIGATVSSDILPARVRHVLRCRSLSLFSHHLCHAASAYMMLPHGTRAGVLVYDGYGSIVGEANDPLRNTRETFSFYVFDQEGHRTIGSTNGLAFAEQDDFPTCVTNSMGMLYELVTGCLGYDPMDSGKTMGLSSHGVPRFLGALEEFVTYGDDASNCFQCTTDDPEFVSAVERICRSDPGGFTVRADLAASVQALMNKTLVHCARFFQGFDIDCLCISGGCGLNTVANSFLVEQSALDRPIFVPPHCGDAGLGFGALWLEIFRRLGRSPELTFRGQPLNPSLGRPGRRYNSRERQSAVQEFYPRVALDSSVASAADLAHVVATGEVVGLLNGCSEIGPRALGGRSIVADPRSIRTRERINRFLKKREPFRPLAPVVLRTQYSQYFEDPRCMDPFMLKIARVTERCRREAPAVVHVDGTARVQVVDDDGDPFLVSLLRSFYRETGVGVLINTSFNRRGEPIVESPRDALDAFLGMGLDGVYLDGEFYRAAPSANPSAATTLWTAS